MPDYTPFSYTNPLINRSYTQTHAIQFDGTDGRGRFVLPYASDVVGVFGNSDTSVDWSLEVVVPAFPGSAEAEADRTYQVETKTASSFLAYRGDWELPAGSIILLKSTAGTNIRGTIILKLVHERH